jgi:hypothetical protein
VRRDEPLGRVNSVTDRVETEVSDDAPVGEREELLVDAGEFDADGAFDLGHRLRRRPGTQP